MRECVRSRAAYFIFQDEHISISVSIARVLWHQKQRSSVKIRCYPTHETFCSLRRGANRPQSANNHAADAALLALCGGVDYGSVETEDACLRRACQE